MINDDAIKTTVLELIAQIAPEADLADIDPVERFRNQFEFDSVDFMNFALALQQRLQITIPEKDYPLLSSLAGCIRYLKSVA